MIKLNLGVALMSALGVFAMLAPRAADATTVKRGQGSMCNILTGTQGTTGGGVFGIWAAADGMELVCPIPEGPDLVRTSVTAVEIYGFDNDVALTSPWVEAKVCRTYSTSDGGTCGTSAKTGSSNFTISPALTAWTSTTGFAYVWVGSMQANDDVRGIYWHD